MGNRRILALIIALVLATTAVGVGTAAVASPGHHGDDHHAAEKSKSKTRDRKKGQARPASSTAVQASAPAGVLGTKEAPRDIAITMTDDLRFDPGTIAVHQGETIRFLLDNPTVAPHDFTLGDLDAQLHHHDEMATGSTHEHGSGGEGGLPGPMMLEPGQTTEVIATFDEPGEILVGCHVPGHWEAGMRGSIVVMPGGVPGAA